MGQPPALDNSQQQRIEMPALAGILVLAALLRFFAIDAQSLWWDEFITLAESTGNYWENDALHSRNVVLQPPPNITAVSESKPWPHVWRAMTHQAHPPLYYMLLRIWRWTFGTGDFAARSLAAVCSIAAVGLAHWAGRLLYDWRVGLWAAAVMALAAPQIVYAQEVRSYALLLALSAGAIVALLWIEKVRPTWGAAAALALCALGMAMTHYFSFGALAALGLYALIRLRGLPLRRALVGFSAAGLIFLLVWGPILLQQRQNVGLGDFLLTQEPNHFFRTLLRIATLPVRYVLSLGGQPLPAAVGIVGAVFWLLPPLLLRRRPDLLLPWLWMAGSVGLLAALDLARGTVHLDFIRYPLIGSIGMYLLIPALLWHLKPIRHAVPALMTIAALMLLSGAYHPWKNQSQNYRQLAMYVKQRVPQDAILVFQTVPPGPLPQNPMEEWAWNARRRMVAIMHYDYSPDRAAVFLDQPASEELVRLLRRAGRFWVITNSWVEPDLTKLPGAQLIGGFDHVPHVGNLFQVAMAPGERPTTSQSVTANP